MHQELIVKAFEKAQKEINRNENYPVAQHLVDIIEKTTGEGCTPKSLVTKYIAAQKGAKNVRLKPFLVSPLCEYLGYQSFEEFEKDYPVHRTTASMMVMLWRKCWFKFLLYHFLLIFIGIGVYHYMKRKRWMVWEKDHYVEVKFDTDSYGTRLKIFNKKRVENFRKIEASCETEFFNPDGSPSIWYGKNKDGMLQYFTDVGLHPETGKSLKPISDYIIDKYVCEEN